MSNASLTTIAYNASTGVLTVTGTNLPTNALVLGDLTLKVSGVQMTLSSSRDTISNLTASGFNVTLSAADQALVNSFFNINGTSTGSQAYGLTASNGWDGNANDTITNIAVTVTGAGPQLSGLSLQTKLLDSSTTNPFSQITITDSNVSAPETASISFTAANGILTGTGLSTVTLNNGIATYTLSVSSATALQQALKGLVFTPTAHQSAAGQTVTTTMTLTVSDQITNNLPLLKLSNGVINPYNLTSDSQGNVWVANYYNNTVEKFSASGVLLNTLSNGLNAPDSLAIDSQGNVWVANHNNNTVEKLSSSGVLLNTLSNGINIPQSLVIDSQGNVWVANNNNNTVEKFSASGVLLSTLSNGISGPQSLSIDSQSNVWVANNNNNSVEKFSSSGVLLNTLSNGINGPDSLAIDSQGSVWVANYNNSTVEKFSSSGVLLNTLSIGINTPDSLAVDSQGNVWVANYYFNTVEKFSTAGVLLNTLSNGISGPQSLSIDSQGNVWVANYYNNTVEKFSSSGVLVSNTVTDKTTQLTVTETQATYNASTGQIKLTGVNPANTPILGDLTLQVGGTQFITLSSNQETISQLSNGFNITLSAADKAIVNTYANTNGSSTGNAAYALLASNAWDGNANDYAANFALTVTGAGPVLAGLSAQTKILDTSTLHPFSSTMVTDSNATVPVTATISFTAVNGFLTGAGLPTAIVSNGVATYTLSANSALALQQSLQGLVFTPTAHQTSAGQIVTTSMTLTVSDQIINNFPTRILSNGIYYPNSLAIDKQGNVWVANYNTVEQFSANGVLLNTINNGISITAGLVIDSQGNIWVANQGKGNILEFSASGLLLNTLTNGVSGPNSLTIDSQGNLWSANYNNNTVEKFSASGVLLNTLSNGISLPRSLAIDGQGNVWVVNSNTVEQFSTSGVLLNTLSNGISFPSSLAIDNQGNVWVANMYNNTVEKFSSSGVLLNTLSNGISNPNSLAIDKQGNVWVGNNNTVEQFSASGVLLNTLSNGISSLTSLTIDGQGNLWVTNSNNTVGKWFISPVTNTITDNTTQITVTETASPVLSQVSYNAGTGQLTVSGSNLSAAMVLGDLTLNAGSQSFSLNASSDTLSDLTATSFTVNLSAADQNRVNAFFNTNGSSSAGSAYSLTASSGWDNSLNGNSAKVAITVSGVGISLNGVMTTGVLQDTSILNPFGKVTLTDSHSFAGEIATISFTAANGMLSGSGLSSASVSNGMATYSLSANSASALQQALQGLVFTPTAHQGAVGQTVTTNLALTISDRVAYPALTLTQSVTNPQSLAIDSQGHVWLANGAFNSASNTVNGSIQEFSSTGRALLNTSPYNSYNPVSLNIDSQGNVWTAGGSGSLNEFSSSGTLLLHDGNAYIYSGAQSFTIDQQGNLWLASLMNSNNFAKLVKLSASDIVLNTLYIPVASGYNSSPVGIFKSTNSVVTDSQNNVWVANSSNHFIQEFSTSGVLMNTLSMGIVDPVSLATDSQGNIWVANGAPVIAGVGILSNNASIEEFSASGALLRTLSGVVANPDFLLTDRFGDLWVADAGNNSVEEFSASGVLLKTLSSGIVSPKSLAIDSQGNLWVANGNNTIEKFLANTPYTSVTNQATSLTVTETTAPALSAVTYNATSGVLMLTGTNLSSALTISDLKLSAGNQYFTLNPTDNVANVTATSLQVSLSAADQTIVNGIFYSNDTGNSKAPFTLTATAGWDHSLSNSTQQTVTVTGAGPVLAGISTSTAILDTGTAQPFSSLILNDANSSASEVATISFTAANGNLTGNGLSTPLISNGIASYTIAASSAANLQQALQGLVFTPTAHQLAKGQTVTSQLTLKITDQSLYSLPVQNFTQGIANPQSLSVDSQGNVWVANGNNTLEKFSANGSLLATLSAGISAPQSVLTDSQGNVWVANQGNWNGNGYSSTVEKFSATGSLLSTLITGISAPQDLVTDSQGNVWVANQGNNTVEKFSASGALLVALSTGIDTANSLATDSLGNVYVSLNTSNGTMNHSFINEFSASGLLLNTITNGINNPVSLATDSQGNVWVANNGGFDWYTGNSQNSSIEKFSASGALLYSLDTNDAVHIALATDSQGNVWVAASSKNNDVYHDLIAEISANGVLEQKMSSGIGMISSLSIDSQGNVWVTDTGHNSVEEFVVNSSTVINQSTQITVTATANSTTTHPVLSIANAMVIQPVHTGDTVIIPDALSFTANAVTAANVTAAGGSVTTLAGWVTGALSVKGANEAAHSIDWFNFNGNTYLVEQANAQGQAYGTGNTIVQLVGVFNEQHASFSGHTLTLA